LSVRDDDGTRLRSGELLSDVMPLLEEFDPAAVFINCSKPEAVDTAVPILAKSGRVVGAYANGFTGIAADFNKVGATVDMLSARRDLDSNAYADFADGWAANGATIIGGCCEV
jgi:S-methylmethionine-dependent homocysteine/selenocysteine methylase